MRHADSDRGRSSAFVAHCAPASTEISVIWNGNGVPSTAVARECCPERNEFLVRPNASLAVPRRLYGRERAGETFTADRMPSPALQWLRANRKLSFIDVTDAAGSTTENGHRYFRKSSWVSSDMLMLLRFGLGPGERGLLRDGESTVWTFPPDYIARLAASVATSGGVPPSVRPQPAAKQ